jgi:hypothetical protein
MIRTLKILLTFGAVAAAVPGAARAQDATLYRAAVVVTGQGEPNRLVGFRDCFGRVLLKLTGDPSIVNDPHFAELAARAPSLVRDFRYRDLFAGRQIHDEQGSYDRPHVLTVTFDRAGIDAAVSKLGRAPWRDARPLIAVFLGVSFFRDTFMLAADGTAGDSADMRAAFAAASERVALPMTLPTRAALQAGGFTAATLPQAAPPDVAAIVHDAGGDVALIGSMRFNEAAHGWIAHWQMDDRGRHYAWGARGVNFDAAFRNALFGAAQILSGHGAPAEGVGK